MAVLVTGATGFLGSHVAQALQNRGGVASGRDQGKFQRLSSRGLRAVRLDSAQPVPAADRDRVGPIDAAVHGAGLSSPWGREAAFVAANLTATEKVLNLATELGAKRFVFVSTASVYFLHKDQDGVCEDNVPARFVNAYAKTNFAAEQAVLGRPELSPIIIRPRGIYGVGDTSLLPRLMRVAAKGALPRFGSDGATDVIHVDDVVSACIAALDARRTKGVGL